MELTAVRKKDNATVVLQNNTTLPDDFFQEYSDYAFDLRLEDSGDSPYDYTLVINDELLDRNVRSRTLIQWQWNTGFYAGEVDVELLCKEKRESITYTYLHPSISKITRLQYDIMVKEIYHETRSIFALSNVKKSVSLASSSPRFPLYYLEYAHKYLSLVKKAIHQINLHPKTSLESDVRTRVPIHKAKKVSAREYFSSLRSSLGARTSSDATSPQYLWHRPTQENFDIYEHQLLKAMLQDLLHKINLCHAQLLSVEKGGETKTLPADFNQSLTSVWIERAVKYKRIIIRLLGLPIFRFFVELSG